MLAIAKGYPLGVINNEYIVQYRNKTINLSFRKAAVWMSFNGVKQIEALNDNEPIFDELTTDGLISKANTLSELFEKLKTAVPFRQGAGSLNGESNAIFLGEKTVCPNSTQSKIWILSDGRKTVSEIYRLLKCEDAVSVDDFILLLSNLDENDLLFFV